ncbi:hypothetical protein [Rhodococcus sp. ARC_M6]|uniref:hypothetical protein n=1 Tax=Rhodococcus sp. ARC_M6 TaxID=2928852 RepID=UPI001FB2E996|nr:hypothetical protein [Rhodococcus sp. ARC_M6]MCJ0904303.1 hypothetical protein [Rhodococcus sp. ARC_M6]
MTADPGKNSGDDFSIGRLALFSLGAAVAALAVTTLLIVLLQPSAGIGLSIGLVGVAAAIAAMGVVSKRMTRKAFGDPKDGSSS